MTDRHMDVKFAVLDVTPEPYAVTPVLTARIEVNSAHLFVAALHGDGAGVRRRHDRGASAGLHLRL
jgi:hypothetical protein